MSLSRSVAGTLGLLLFLSGCAPQTPPVPREVTLYFYSQEDLQNADFTNPVTVTRPITTDEPMDEALRQLFAGPTPEEQQEGARGSDDLRRLGDFYLGVTVGDGTAVVNFRRDALPILNSAAARQMMAKGPMELTLREFEGVERVEYAIDGTIFTEWDA